LKKVQAKEAKRLKLQEVKENEQKRRELSYDKRREKFRRETSERRKSLSKTPTNKRIHCSGALPQQQTIDQTMLTMQSPRMSGASN